ncbi:chemotaxis-specific protein-glutamate methyltransferase CheB [Silvanigrella paludirubra]|uniref:Protein-glutamate methylesterase/protein-glutamine glutaminase n=1 Tax=Silvanigrella paludirubra TaxID=2499159 RepID=A0A6N6VUD2_9BACT|nr:chemotaxis-specific protein-glutamate methyltransferase CheB [Silvanigrella paludirubra]KAB8039671.1 chemotaxis-specific protein-glutamate methyltransferase CheB [Silvanigrella paludirubra]
MRVLIVDDSVVFRSQIKAALEENNEIVVVNTAANGKIALERLEQNVVDVVILDLEMPVMDGIQMLEEMRKKGFHQKVIIFAAPTGEGVDLALKGLRGGAADFISKPSSSSESLEQALEGIKKELIPKILQFKNQFKGNTDKISQPITENQIKKFDNLRDHVSKNEILSFKKPRVIGIGSSTGGPTALEKILINIKSLPLNIPIFIAQHMPPKFTEALARRLETICGHPVHEATHGAVVLSGHIYVAPGDFHMTVEKLPDANHCIIQLDQGPKRNSVRPAVDNLFESLAKVYGNQCVAFILTGMGEDGMVGAKAIKDASGSIIIQDAQTSTVWGMPGAVYASGNYDAMVSIDGCSDYLVQMVK